MSSTWRAAWREVSGWASASTISWGMPKSVAPPPLTRSTTSKRSPALAGAGKATLARLATSA